MMEGRDVKKERRTLLNTGYGWRGKGGKDRRKNSEEDEEGGRNVVIIREKKSGLTV